MYRVRTATRNVPLLISPGMIEDYSLNTVNTLHLKNLLHLGEDRYLTTLMLKHFPEMKTSFTADAQCKTNCPDKWSVLQSQRRRWINSTVHNLLELMFLPDLCVVQPAVLIYIGYLVYSVVFDQNSYFPLISIIMIAAMYGFQIIIFLLRKEWAHLGWMIIYLLATPLYTFWLPIYSFWHFDDFSWGDTRRVVGENGKEKWQSKEQDEFDTSSIPVRPWAEYERELLEKVVDDASSLHSSQNGSEGSQKYVATSYGPGSVYADGSTFGVPQMGYQASYAGSAFGGSVYPAPPPSTLGYVPTAPPTAAGSVYDYAMDPRKRQSGYFIGGGPPSVAGDWNPFSSAGRHSQYPPGFSATGANFSGELPSDEELLEEIRHILSTRDLMTVTKKSVREELSQLFNIDMSSKKDYIHKCIDLILKSQT
ncbi:hypothetical protein HK096_010001 [Nowakowskiella sp. JEL0078]|nr:hypothetical protein HK096_010001 [Nowakowskiella sp. JEL0078]